MIVIAACHMSHSKDGARELSQIGCHVIPHFDVTDHGGLDKVLFNTFFRKSRQKSYFSPFFRQIRSQVEEILSSKEVTLWAVVNNAACVVFGEIEWQTRRQIQLQMDVNVVGPTMMAKTFLPLLRKSKV